MSTLCVTVTRGTSRKPVCYARDIATLADARRMRATAMFYKYDDAEIEDQADWDESQQDD